MPEILMEIIFFTQRPDFWWSNGFFILDYLVEKSNGALLNRLVLEKVPVILREGWFLWIFLRRLNYNISYFAFQVADDF